MDIVEGGLVALAAAGVVTAAPMALRPRVLGQQQLRTRVVAGEEHHLLLDAFGVSIALEPRLASVAELVAGLGRLDLCGDERRCLRAVLRLQRMVRSQLLRRTWYYVIRKAFATRYSYMPKHLPPIRHGYRPDWWWPKRSVEVAALRELGELHYWERPSDPLWFERHVEPVVSPLAEQSAAQLAATPPSCVPHLPYLPHPWPRSPRPFHVASPVGTPDAARLLSDGHSPVTAQAPTGDAGLEGGGGAMFMDG